MFLFFFILLSISPFSGHFFHFCFCFYSDLLAFLQFMSLSRNVFEFNVKHVTSIMLFRFTYSDLFVNSKKNKNSLIRTLVYGTVFRMKKRNVLYSAKMKMKIKLNSMSRVVIQISIMIIICESFHLQKPVEAKSERTVMWKIHQNFIVRFRCKQ